MDYINRIKELLHKFPNPPDIPIPDGIGDDEIDAFQLRTGLSVPDQLRAWLKLSNGPCVGPGWFFGINTNHKSFDLEYILSLYPDWLHAKWIPITCDGCGNYYIVPTLHEFGQGYPVLFIDTIHSLTEPAYIASSNILNFILRLIDGELNDTNWPFDESETLSTDPEILSFKNVMLPWDA